VNHAKILVIDDNSATRQIVRLTLENRGHQVIEAASYRAALDRARSETMDLALVDLRLPDGDGIALAGALRQHVGEHVPLLAFSGFVSQTDQARMSSAGFDGIITKPIELASFASIVESHLCAAHDASEPFGAGRRLVVADDDPLQLRLTCFRLERLGFVVEPTRDGRDALEAARRRQPCAIVGDVLMPNLDGFGLALAIREDVSLAGVPVLLVTSSYVEPSDRELARRAGANDLVVRTDEMTELVATLRALLEDPPQGAPVDPVADHVARDHALRIVQQLERQLRLNSGLAQRCASLASQLAVLSGISDTVIEKLDVNAALDEALTACFDAGGIQWGALALFGEGTDLTIRRLPGTAPLRESDLGATLEDRAMLREIVACNEATVVRLASTERALVLPLVHRSRALGALVVVFEERLLRSDDWRAFANGIASQITHGIALAREFQDKVRAENVAKGQSALLAAVLDGAPDLVMQLDRDGRILFVNRAIPGFERTEVIGTDWDSYVPYEQRHILRAALERVLESGIAVTYESQGIEADGETLAYSSRIGPIRIDGEVAGAVVVARDVTSEKERAERLIASDRMASLGTLALGVGHEMKNPLGAVLANLEVVSAELESAGASAELRAALDDAREAATRVRTVIRDLDTFGRPNDTRAGPVDVQHVLESSVRMAWSQIRDRARLVREYGNPPPAYANDTRLGQVFLNLLVNAAQAIPEGESDRHEIRIRTSCNADGQILVAITDTGHGIASDVKERIFTPFVTTKPPGFGTGLGLATCRRLVNEFGGEIGFDSETVRGTVFWVVLPRAVEPSE
jgi:PAS domain S-box-containing protein